MPSILTVIRKEFILLILIYNMQDPAFPRCCLSKWSGLQELFANSSFLPLSPLSSDFFPSDPRFAYAWCQRLFMRGFRFRSSLKKWHARSSPLLARKNLWYPGYISRHSLCIRYDLYSPGRGCRWYYISLWTGLSLPFPRFFSPNREPVHRLTLHKLFGPAGEVPLYLPLIDCSQSPIFSLDRRDIARLTVKGGHLDLYRGDGRRVL